MQSLYNCRTVVQTASMLAVVVSFRMDHSGIVEDCVLDASSSIAVLTVRVRSDVVRFITQAVTMYRCLPACPNIIADHFESVEFKIRPHVIPPNCGMINAGASVLSEHSACSYAYILIVTVGSVLF